jgi:hypothetical protein
VIGWDEEPQHVHRGHLTPPGRTAAVVVITEVITGRSTAKEV